MSTPVLAAVSLGAAASIAAPTVVSSARRLRSTAVFRSIVPSARSTRNTEKLSEQLAPALQLVVGNLRIGRNVLGSIDDVADATPAPLGDILHEAVTEAKLGTPVGEVLGSIAHREESRHLGIVASALSLQARHGGSLIEILDTVIETIEEEDRLRRDVKSVTADGRLSSTVLLAMPPVVLLLISVLSPGYAEPLVATRLGNVLIVAAVGLGGVGWRWLRALANPEITL